MRCFKRERECYKRIPKCQRAQMAFGDNFHVAGASGVIATRLDSKWRERLFLWMAASRGASPWRDDSTLQTRACFRRKHLFRMRPSSQYNGARETIPAIG